MQKFRKKPVEVEAVRNDGGEEKAAEIIRWVTAEGGQAQFGNATGQIYIDTLEGTMEVPPDFWVIKGVEGEFYGCKDSVFRRTYEEVE